MEAEFTLEYPSAQFAKSVMQAIRPDNKLTSRGMQITAEVQGRRLLVRVKNCERVETLEATVQDLFRCIRAAETSLSASGG